LIHHVEAALGLPAILPLGGRTLIACPHGGDVTLLLRLLTCLECLVAPLDALRMWPRRERNVGASIHTGDGVVDHAALREA
jgi:hypothetical protein